MAYLIEKDVLACRLPAPSNAPLSTRKGKTRKPRGSDWNGKDDGDARGTMENPNCCTKLSRNQVPGNPRAFKYFGTIAKANYVADVRTGAALKRLDNGADTRAHRHGKCIPAERGIIQLELIQIML